MEEYSEAFVAFDVAKKKHAVAIRRAAALPRFGLSARLRTVRQR